MGMRWNFGYWLVITLHTYDTFPDAEELVEATQEPKKAAKRDEDDETTSGERRGGGSSRGWPGSA